MEKQMHDYNKPQVTIKIGELYAAAEPAVIYTLLGSCVAVCMYDIKNKIGGMNHIFLPGNDKMTSSTRYGENAMKHLIRRIINLGGNRENIVAKAFGGGHVIPVLSEEGVGSKIIAFVTNFLKENEIKLVASDFGGNMPRKVFFHTDTGTAYVKQLAPHSINIANRKKL